MSSGLYDLQNGTFYCYAILKFVDHVLTVFLIPSLTYM